MPSRRVFLAATVSALAARRALALAPPVRTTGFLRSNGSLLVSVGAQDVLHGLPPRRLTSGVATRVLIRTLLTREGTSLAIATATRHAEIVYDVWDERFYVYRSQPGRVTEELVAADADRAALDAATLRHFPVAPLSALLPGVHYRLLVKANLNPLSPELVAEVRRWLAPRPGQGRLAPGDAFFGSFVSIFVNPRVEESERVVEFASQRYRHEVSP